MDELFNIFTYHSQYHKKRNVILHTIQPSWSCNSRAALSNPTGNHRNWCYSLHAICHTSLLTSSRLKNPQAKKKKKSFTKSIGDRIVFYFSQVLKLSINLIDCSSSVCKWNSKMARNVARCQKVVYSVRGDLGSIPSMRSSQHIDKGLKVNGICLSFQQGGILTIWWIQRQHN